MGYLYQSVYGHALSPSYSTSRDVPYKDTCPNEQTHESNVQQALLATAKKQEPSKRPISYVKRMTRRARNKVLCSSQTEPGQTRWRNTETSPVVL